MGHCRCSRRYRAVVGDGAEAVKHDNDNHKPRRPVALPVLTEGERRSFWATVDRSAGHDSCWPWTGITEPYGRVKIRGKLYLAHRVAFALVHGLEAAVDALVRHSCDNPPCCNPAHLLSGSYADNTADMLDRGRANPRRGESNVRAIANDDLVREILAAPMSGRKTAAHFGVSYGLVANIRAGRSWKHIANDNGAAGRAAAA